MAVASEATTSDLDPIGDMAYKAHGPMEFEVAREFTRDPANGMYDFDSGSEIHNWVALDRCVVL